MYWISFVWSLKEIAFRIHKQTKEGVSSTNRNRPLHRLHLRTPQERQDNRQQKLWFLSSTTVLSKEAKKYLQKAYSKKDVDYLLNHNK